MKERIADFSGDRYFLSNFYACRVCVEGKTFTSVEQYYQYKKCTNTKDQDRIMMAKSPGETKRIGKSIKIRPDWEQVKLPIMYAGVLAKFTQNLSLKKQLLDTKNDILEEGNNWGDMYWGVDYYTRKGENHLGKILMHVRAELMDK